MITKLIIFNNPLFAYEYHAEIDLVAGQVVYKTNTVRTDNIAVIPKFYECFYLLPRARINNFMTSLELTTTWKPLYGEGKLCIDGGYWSVKIFGDTEREIKGYNAEPSNFGEFISALEALLQKDFTVHKRSLI